MQFSMTKPCADCPWRTDIDFYLHPARVVEILTAGIQGNETFTCHHTISGERTDDGYRPGHEDQHCAGMLILIARERTGHSMTQIAERFGLYDPSKLEMNSPVFPTVEAILERYEASETGQQLVRWMQKVRPHPSTEGDPNVE